jgi:outer membrane biosynthesis protein TonB
VSEDRSVSIARVVGPLDPALDQAAVRAVLDWKYRPAQLGDRTVSAWVEESVSFKP